jgi:hypothetical protein
MKLAVLTACIVTCLAIPGLGADRRRNVSSLTTYSDQVIPLVIVGEGWSQQIVISNVSDPVAVATGTLSFFTSDGKPWEVELRDRQKASTYLVNINAGGVAIYETLVRDFSQLLGWALLELNSRSGDCLMQSIWRKQTTGRPDLMTSTVASGRSLLPSQTTTFFNSTEGRYHGIGIVFAETCSGLSRCTQPNRFRARLIAPDGSVLSEKIIDIKPGNLFWSSLETEFPTAIGKMGSFEVRALDGGPTFAPYLSGFSLQFSANGAFTAVAPFEY